MTDSNNNDWQDIPKEENPNAIPPKKDDEWDQTWQDVKAGFSQVEKALREAYLKSKDDPRYNTDREQFPEPWCSFGSVHHHCSATAFASSLFMSLVARTPLEKISICLLISALAS